MKSRFAQSGFTLHEVLISLALITILGVAAIPAMQSEMQENIDSDAAHVAENYIEAFKKFRAEHRRSPTSIDELVNSPYFTGNRSMPWGAGMAGSEGASGKSYGFTFQAGNTAQAQRLAGLLSKFGASSTGSLVTMTSTISTIETIENQMLCRRDIGVPGCNRLEISLDAGDNDILGIKDFEGQTGRLDSVISDEASINRLVTEDEIVLGSNSISHSGGTLQFNAGMTSFSGDISVNGDLVGNNSNISNVNRFDADVVNVDLTTADIGVISELSGSALDFTSGSFNSVDATSTNADVGTFGTVTSDSVSSSSVTTNTFSGSSGSFASLSATTSQGTQLSLSGLLDVGSFNSDSSSLGNATGTSLNVTGRISGSEAVFTRGDFGSVYVSGSVNGGNFQGSNFTTSKSSVNENKNILDQQADEISANASRNSTNRRNIDSLSQEVSSNTNDIASLESDIYSNKQLAQSTASKVSSNTSAITTLKNRASTVEQKAASLESQLQNCRAQGGCSW